LIEEDGWDSRLQGIREAQFTLGNGYIGSRGILEEIPYDASLGTYIAGVYNKAGAQVTELVNLPNPIDFRLVSQGEKLGIGAMDVINYRRILDMKKGILHRYTLYRNVKRERIFYQSLRFFSMDDHHLGVLKIAVTPLDAPLILIAETFINTAVTNKGILTEGRKKHIQVM